MRQPCAGFAGGSVAAVLAAAVIAAAVRGAVPMVVVAAPHIRVEAERAREQGRDRFVRAAG